MADRKKCHALCLVNLLIAQEGQLGSSNQRDVSATIAAIHKAPDEAFCVQVDKDDNLLLHKAVLILSKYQEGHVVVSSIVEEIILKNPSSASKTNRHGQLPLHLACDHDAFATAACNDFKRVLDLLIMTHPKSTTEPDKNGLLPLHYAARRNWGEGTDWKSVLEEHIITKDAAKTKDNNGLLPLHYVAKADIANHDLFLAILNEYPDALKVKSNRGDLPIHCAAKRGDIHRFKVLAERYLTSLQVRNGSGAIPLQVAAGISWGSNIVLYLCVHHGASLPPGVDLSEQARIFMSQDDKSTVSDIVSIMSPEHFALALDRNLAQYKLPKLRRQMVVHAVREFTKRLHQKETAEHRRTAANAKVEVLTKQVETIELTVSELGTQIERGKERESRMRKKYSDLKSQIDQGKEREFSMEKKCSDLKSQVDRGKERESSMGKKYSDLKSQVDRGKERELSMEEKCSDLKSQIDQGKERESSVEKKCSNLKSQIDKGKERESSMEKKCSDLKSQIDQGKERESQLEKKNLDLESRLTLENCWDRVSSLVAKHDQTAENYADEARGYARVVVLDDDNMVPRNNTINALMAFAQSLNERLAKMRAQRSTAQRLLPFLLAQYQPTDQADLIHVVQTLNSELAEVEDEISKTNEQGTAQPSTRSIGDVDGPTEEPSTKKRARVSLCQTPGRDDSF